MGLQERLGLDFGVFKQKQTWQAFGISIVLFSIIATAALTLFDSAAKGFGTTDEAELATDFVVDTVNRSGIEDSVTNDTGIFRLSDHRGKIVIIDFMAISCTGCEWVTFHIDEELSDWQSMGGYDVVVVSIGVYYSGSYIESIEDLSDCFGDNDTDGEAKSCHYTPWTLATGAVDAAILDENGSLDGTREDLMKHYSVTAPPVVYVIDHEGYPVAKEVGGSSVKDWSDFDEKVERAIKGEAGDDRFGIEALQVGFWPVFVLGLFVGLLVYFSPCAFPVLPSYISYYLNLGLREEEMKESGKLKGSMPSSLSIGLLAGVGMVTFFLVIGVAIVTLNRFIDFASIFLYIAYFVAVLLTVLGAFMLMGGTAKLMSFVQRLVDRWSTTEADDKFTPRRNMFLYGIGYAAASIDCTAAAVLPFIAYTTIAGDGATIAGLTGLMLSVVLLMTAVTMMVGLGRTMFIDFLRRATGIIKMVGAWMMTFAGLGLIYYLSAAGLQF
jgi:cytochrome c-type biogenesis protein